MRLKTKNSKPQGLIDMRNKQMMTVYTNRKPKSDTHRTHYNSFISELEAINQALEEMRGAIIPMSSLEKITEAIQKNGKGIKSVHISESIETFTCR